MIENTTTIVNTNIGSNKPIPIDTIKTHEKSAKIIVSGPIIEVVIAVTPPVAECSTLCGDSPLIVNKLLFVSFEKIFLDISFAILLIK
jgi:hypothetical protein